MFEKYLFYQLLFGLAFLYLAIGLWTAQSIRTLKDYFLANRSLGVFPLTFALIATQLGSGMVLGTGYRAYFIGFWALLYIAGLSAGLILLGCGIAARMRSLGIATVAEIFQTHYGSPRLKIFASILSIICLWGILIAQIVASKALFLGLKITDPYIFISSWLFIIVYSMIGGLSSIVWVDVIQIAFIAIAFVWSCKWVVPKTILKYLTVPKLAQIQHHFFHTSTTFKSSFSVFLMPMLFSLITQDVAQKFFAAKTKMTATIASLLAAIFLIIFSCVPVYLGIMAKIERVNIANNANPLVTVLQKLCPDWMFIVLMCAILGGIMTTASSLLCAINSNIVQDFTKYLHFEHKKLWMTKVIAFCIGISAMIASLWIQSDIITILEESYRLFIVCLFVPIFIAYVHKPMKSAPAWTACLCGFTAYVGLHWSTISQTSKDLTALALSLLGFCCAYLFI